MKKCCFCWDVRGGTIASAIFILVTRGIAVVLFSTILGLRSNDPFGCAIRYEDDSYKFDNYTEMFIPKGRENPSWYCADDFDKERLIISIAFGSLHLICSTILLIGVAQRKRSLFWPWMTLLGVEIVAGLGFIIMLLMSKLWIRIFIKFFMMIAGISLQCYMLSCVSTYYKQLVARGNNTVYNVVSSNNSNIPHEVTNAPPPPLYNTSLIYDNPPFTDHPPSYDNKLISFYATSLEDKPPSYDDIKTNNYCKKN